MRLILVFLLAGLSLHAQDDQSEPIQLKATPENFERAMSFVNPTARQVDTIIQLSIEYSFLNEDTCIILGLQSVEVSKNLEDLSSHAKALLELGDTYRIFGDLGEGEKLIEKGKKIYEDLEDKGQIAYANMKLGAVMKNRGDDQAAINYYLSALETWEIQKDSQKIIMPYINIGAAFQSLRRLRKAEQYYLKALEFANHLKDNRGKMYVLNNQAIVYTDFANRFLSKADSFPDTDKVFRDSADLYSDKAIDFYQQSLALANEMNDKSSIIRSLGNLANAYFSKSNYSEALSLSKQAETLSADLGDNNSTLSIKTMLTKSYFYTDQMDQAIAYGENAVKIARDKGMERHQAEANNLLYQIYKKLGSFEKALSNYESFKAYNEKLIDDKRNKAIAEVEEKYQSVQKEKQILEQNNEILELEKTNAKISRQRNLYTGSAGLLVVFGFLGFQINRIRRERNDKKAFAEALINAQEEDRKRIARDLHDGVGQSLLLIKKQLETSNETGLANQKIITDTLEEVRSISRDLHPFQLEKFGLTATLTDAIQKVDASTDLFITKELENIDGLLSEKAEINIFRTIQEALNNIIKHSEASAAKVTLNTQGEEVLIKIQDNGKGFDHELAVVKSKSLGLRTMYERISNIGGKLKIERGTPKGTIIDIKIPKTQK